MANQNSIKKPKYDNMKQLEERYSLNLNIYKKGGGRKIYDAMERLNFLLMAQTLHKEGNDEDAYVFIMKYLSLMSFFTHSQEYKDHKNYYQEMIGHKFLQAIELAEILKKKVSDLYSGVSKIGSSAGQPNSVTETAISVDELSDEIKSSEEQELAFDTEIEKPVKNITAAGLFTEMKKNEKQVLIMDTRRASDFEESHINQQSLSCDIINVPQHVIKPGISAKMVEDALGEAALPFWKKRGSYAMVVLLDWGRDDLVASVLRDILTQFDLVTYKSSIRILKGGYSEWMEVYPWATTKILNITASPVAPVSTDWMKIDYSFDFDIEDVAKPYFNRATKPLSTANKLEIPKIDRSVKQIALKTYAERDAAMAHLLRQKDQETREALELEKERFRRELQLQEDLRRQRELEIDEERRAILLDEGAKLLVELDALKKESASKDTKIQELQTQIEEYEKSSNIKTTIEEKEIGNKIKNREDETKHLKEECDALERKQEGYRQKLWNHVNQNNARPLHNVANLEVNVDSKVPERPRIPYVNRATKPQILSDPIIGESPGLTGLKNLGNTCYMNSILQCISNNSTLAKYFYEFEYLHDLNRSHRTRGEVAEKVAAVVRELWSGHRRSVACNAFKNTVGSIKSEYRTYEQQDSHEFLTFLMDWLHNDLKKESGSIKEINVRSDMEKAWMEFMTKNESLISTLFYGLQKSTVTCRRCHENSATYEPFSNLSLIIPDGPSVTLKECLQLYLKREIISGWRCPKCKDEREAEKRTELCKLPSILVIHLKRFSFLDVHSRKRTTFVDFPLDNLTIDCTEDQNTVYSLYGVSNHYGTMEGGHYTAYCKNSVFKRWYKFDDHEVVEIAPSDVKTNAAYILFYNNSTKNHTRPS